MGLKRKMSDLPITIKILAVLGLVKVQQTNIIETRPSRHHKNPNIPILQIVILTGVVGAAIYLMSDGLGDNQYDGMSSLQKELTKNAKSYEQLIEGMSDDNKAKIAPLKELADNSSCEDLIAVYKANPLWSIRPYLAYVILEQGCQV